MKRFHVHLTVESIDQSVAFYSALFGQAPTKQKGDYAKWMMDDPRVNFAISTRGTRTHLGLDHFGMQVDSENELDQIRELANAASSGELLDEGSATCCYANSEKHWTVDPQGVAWEHFQTFSDSPDYQDSAGQCCIPVREAQSECCVPMQNNNGQSCC
ncbi:MAG: ArsI/CadI family heavy metal resistance metalloenzyme [Pseudomonadota bacterium]